MALQEIDVALSQNAFDKAATIAEQRLGMSSLELHGAAHMASFMPQAMQEIGTQMHRAASRFAIEAQICQREQRRPASVGRTRQVSCSSVSPATPFIVCTELRAWTSVHPMSGPKRRGALGDADVIRETRESAADRRNRDMELNADFSRRVVIDTLTAPWIASPEPGVERKLLDRVGDEVARATSIVRYAPGSAFVAHEHALGEEFLVLSGTFEDECGEYPAGTYVRNPPGSRHRPFSTLGCELFVKLRQSQPGDGSRVAMDTRRAVWHPGLVPGLTVLPLHEYGSEHVALVRWAPETRFQKHSHWGGEEILVLEGVFSDELGDYPAGTWIRSPAPESPSAVQ